MEDATDAMLFQVYKISTSFHITVATDTLQAAAGREKRVRNPAQASKLNTTTHNPLASTHSTHRCEPQKDLRNLRLLLSAAHNHDNTSIIKQANQYNHLTMLAFRQYSRVMCSSALHRAFSSASARPFQILGLQQIAVGSLDKKPLADLWGGIFGLEKAGSFSSEAENVDEDIMNLGSGVTAVEVDLMTPLNAEKSPKVHSPALNHIGLWVDDLETAVDWMKGQGMYL